MGCAGSTLRSGASFEDSRLAAIEDSRFHEVGHHAQFEDSRLAAIENCRFHEVGHHAQFDEGGRFKQLPPADDDAKLLVANHPSLGVIRLDYDYPPALGDVDHPGSFYYDVFYRVVPGLTFELCQSGELPDDVKQRFIDAITWLDEQGVAGITGDCGFFMYFQALARSVTSKPVFMSSLCQLPAVVCAYAADEQIALFTANGESLKPMRELIKKECGVDPDDTRFVIVGCEDVPGFEAVANGDRVDVDSVVPHLVRLAEDTVAKHAGTAKPIRAILFECTELPPYSDAVRAATRLPVFDSITCCNSMLASLMDNPRFGVNNWHLSWDGAHTTHRFGDNVPPHLKGKLVNREHPENVARWNASLAEPREI